MSKTAELDRAFEVSSAVLANVGPDQLELQTPCASWKVRDLINHMVGAAEGFATVAEGGTPSREDNDYASGDYQANYAAQRERAVAAFSVEGALEQPMAMPFGTLPGAAVMGMAMTDTFGHAWDLARSTGQSTDLDPELAAALLERSKTFIQPAFWGEDGKAPFGPEVEVPESAPAADRLAGFLGRPV